MARLEHTTPQIAMVYQETASERAHQLANQMPRPGGNVVPIAARRKQKAG